jgi:hypothetical protein
MASSTATSAQLLGPHLRAGGLGSPDRRSRRGRGSPRPQALPGARARLHHLTSSTRAQPRRAGSPRLRRRASLLSVSRTPLEPVTRARRLAKRSQSSVVLRPAQGRKTTGQEGDVVEAGVGVGVQIAAQPPRSRPAVAVGALVRDQMDELEQLPERRPAELSQGRLGDEQVAVLARPLEQRTRMTGGNWCLSGAGGTQRLTDCASGAAASRRAGPDPARRGAVTWRARRRQAVQAGQASRAPRGAAPPCRVPRGR